MAKFSFHANVQVFKFLEEKIHREKKRECIWVVKQGNQGLK